MKHRYSLEQLEQGRKVDRWTILFLLCVIAALALSSCASPAPKWRGYELVFKENSK